MYIGGERKTNIFQQAVTVKFSNLDLKIPFGKYLNYTIGDIMKLDPQYIAWLLSKFEPTTSNLIDFKMKLIALVEK